MDTKGLDRLQHRCGTCSEIFHSIEELREHEKVHALPADEGRESASVNGVRYYRAYYAHSVEISHWLNHSRAGKVLPPDEF